ncbi:MAG: pantoate--beta-alanine ligase [Candidatus Gastranaerophilales bacterium]|nr:pantoate--beta-alanine ligase [Candidatus Gastranaerophilales bacterium]
MQVISTVRELNETVKQHKLNNKKVGLVPTMGALHKGHKSLMECARKECDIVVVSVFVNPTQFGPNEDYDKYPRVFDKDIELCESAGVDIIFHPEPEEMYPDFKKGGTLKENLQVKENSYIIKVPEKYTNRLCGKTRPGHFDGVCTIVSKLFAIVKPDVAYFGQKDIQQLIIIKNMCKSMNSDIKIQGCPIVREESGLALSSRNSYLSEVEKVKASTIFKVLSKAVMLFKNGNNNKKDVFEESLKLLDKDINIEYLEVCDCNTLDYCEKIRHNSFIAIAAKVGNVRLIDNVIIG